MDPGDAPPAWDEKAEQGRRVALDAAVAAEAMVGRVLVAVIVPVLRRPHRVAPLLDSFRAATSRDDAAVYFVAQHSDNPEVAAIHAAGYRPILVDDAHTSWAKKINRGYENTAEPWLLLAADDLRFHAGWVDVIRSLLFSHPGVIGTNDLGNASTFRGTASTHSLVRRRYADICGTADERGKVVHEGYRHNWPDTELEETARRRGLCVHRRDCVVEHLHPRWRKAQEDEVYALGRSHAQHDRELFYRRGSDLGFLCRTAR